MRNQRHLNRQLRWAPLIAFVSLGLYACSGGEIGQPYVPTVTPGIADTLSCEPHITVFDTQPDGFVVSEVASLAIADVEAHQIGRQGMDNDPDSARRFSKVALAVRNGSRLSLYVHSESQGNALMTWGNQNNGSPGFAVDIESCVDPAEGWSMFPGGLWVLEPDCVKLVAQEDGEEAVVIELPVGTTCPA